MRSARAFTLIEIMMVVLIIGIIVAIAAPQWIQSRENTRQKACVENLREIEEAKECWAMQNNIPNGGVAVVGDLVPVYIKSTFPSCPSGGVYTIQPVGTSPTCTYLAGAFPHLIP
ncbi:MAG: prepilin-type N-terminal cleavage/methylation domain-containing protein [Fimbriimonas ginsengisoli]|nr:prepilin-type N-terminal cleavage/methylation domain-containing protein [Fimbriimonas ginsengisoli]